MYVVPVDCQQHCQYKGELALLAAGGRHLQIFADVLIAAAAGVVVMKGPVAAAVLSVAFVENGEGLMETGLLKSGVELVYGG